MWTFAYDISGIASVTFYYRKDMDGINPIEDTANEVYHSGLSLCPYALRQHSIIRFHLGFDAGGGGEMGSVFCFNCLRLFLVQSETFANVY